MTHRLSLWSEMTNLPVWLTSQGLHNILREAHGCDFTFIVAEKQFLCPSFIAEFLSPKISRRRKSDPTLTEFIIDIDDPSDDFSKVLSLGSGLPLQRYELNQEVMTKICCQLGNQELLDAIVPTFHDDLTCHNVLNRLLFLAENHMNYEAELDFAALHFSELQTNKTDQLNKLSADQLYGIISRKSLTIRCEDSLWEFIDNNWTKLMADTSSFLEFIHFEYLSKSSMFAFCERIADSPFDLLTPNVWKRLSCRLIMPVIAPRPVPLKQDPLSGIIAYLTRKYGEDLHDRGIVRVTIRDFAPGEVPRMQNVLEFTNTKHIWTGWDHDQQWICWDFGQARLRATHYSIRSEPFKSHPRDWVLEGLTGISQWTVLDERRGNFDLAKSLTVATFSITRPAEVRGMLRIRQIGWNHNGNHCLSMSSFEVFGEITEYPE
jgi:hypothetical protein